MGWRINGFDMIEGDDLVMPGTVRGREGGEQ